MKGLMRSLRIYFKKIDASLLVACLFVSALSIVLLSGIIHTGYASNRALIVQVVALVLGLLCMVILSLLDYKFLAGLWRLYAPLGYGLVLLTFIIGTTRGDDKAWIIIGPVSLQPAEFLKIAFILAFALHLEKIGDKLNDLHNLIPLVAHGLVPVTLAHFQGDDGTALVFACIFFSMLFAAGLSWRYIFTAAGIVAVTSPLAWYFVFTDDQRKRFMILFNPELDPLGGAWQQLNGVLAIGSGQIWGKGIFTGEHIRVPEIRNDFIFAFLGESLGFMGCLLVIALMFFICLRMLLDSTKSRDACGRYICVGVFGMIAFQAIINIGMCLSVLPVIGVTLPLLSSGGTSVLSTYLGLGLVLSVHAQNRNVMFE